VQNAFGETQNIVVLGGMSEIGLAIAASTDHASDEIGRAGLPTSG